MFICFASFSNAQNDFEKAWKEVVQLEKEGLTKSASDVVETIYQNATSNNNQQQKIKALLYKSKYMLVLEEETQLKIVNNFRSTIQDLSLIHI